MKISIIVVIGSVMMIVVVVIIVVIRIIRVATFVINTVNIVISLAIVRATLASRGCLSARGTFFGIKSD